MWSSSGHDHDSGALEKSGVPTVHSASKGTANGRQQHYSIGEDLSVLLNGAVVKLS